jgi:hypothetical protein
MTHQRYITCWAKVPPDSIFEWNHYVSESLEEVGQLIGNLRKRGVIQYQTYPIGDKMIDHSSQY